jgi:hypothetical protein
MDRKRRPTIVVALLAGSLLVPAASWAALIPSKAAPAAPVPERDADLETIKQVLARGDVARALTERGLAADEVENRLARLSDEDVRSLASHVEQVQAAGDVPHYIWVLLGIFLAVSILVMIF